MPKLTVASIEKIKPRENRFEVSDTACCPGLFLTVQPSGAKSFALRFRNESGRHTKLWLGPYDGVSECSTAPMIGAPLTLIAARQLAMHVHRQRVAGADVVGQRRVERLERKAGLSKTFSAACLDFTEQYLKRETRRWQRTARLLGIVTGDDGALAVAPRSLSDRWRDRAIGEISADDIHAIIDEARERSVPGLERKGDGPSESMARIMHTTLSKLFGWLLEKRRISTNPMRDSITPKSGKSRERVLDDRELIAFWAACATINSPLAQCLRLLALTGCRRDEIGKLRRDEISADGATITISADRAKNGKAHVVPLPPQAREILASVKTSGDFVFSGKSIAWSRVKRQLDSVLKFSTPFVLHDLRRTFSTGMNKIGIRPEVVEAALNHVSGKSSVAGTYN